LKERGVDVTNDASFKAERRSLLGEGRKIEAATGSIRYATERSDFCPTMHRPRQVNDKDSP